MVWWRREDGQAAVELVALLPLLALLAAGGWQLAVAGHAAWAADAAARAAARAAATGGDARAAARAALPARLEDGMTVEEAALLPLVLLVGVAVMALLAARSAAESAAAAAEAGAMALIQDEDPRAA